MKKRFSKSISLIILMLILSLVTGSVAPLASPAEASAATTLNGQTVETRRVGAVRGRGGVELAQAASLRTQLVNTAAAAVDITPGSMLIRHGSRELLILADTRTAFLTTGVGTRNPRTASVTLSVLPRTVGGRDLFLPLNDVMRHLGGSFPAARTARLGAATPAAAFAFADADRRNVVAGGAGVGTELRMIGRGATFPNSLYGRDFVPGGGAAATSWFARYFAGSEDLSVTTPGHGTLVGYNRITVDGDPAATGRIPETAETVAPFLYNVPGIDGGATVGSGVGVDAVRLRLADFGGTDMISQVPAAVLEAFPAIPTVKGGVAVIFNLLDANGTRINHLNLTADTIARIYLGQISRWNDPALVRLNPGVALPDQPIQVNWRPDVSGTTEIFTAYLNAASRVWRETLTAAQRTAVDTDDVVRAGVGGWALPVIGPGADGLHGTADDVRLADRVQPAAADGGGSRLRDRVNGATHGVATNAIGFVSYGDVVSRLATAPGGAGLPTVRNLGVARVQNRAGIFVLPLIANVYAAGIGHGNMLTHPVNGANPGAYPITGLTWIMVERDASVGKPVGDSVQIADGNPAIPGNQPDTHITAQSALADVPLADQRRRAAVVVDFIRWAVVEGFGDAHARDLHMAPLTPAMKREAARLLNTIVVQTN